MVSDSTSCSIIQMQLFPDDVKDIFAELNSHKCK